MKPETTTALPSRGVNYMWKVSAFDVDDSLNIAWTNELMSYKVITNTWIVFLSRAAQVGQNQELQDRAQEVPLVSNPLQATNRQCLRYPACSVSTI